MLNTIFLLLLTDSLLAYSRQVITIAFLDIVHSNTQVNIVMILTMLLTIGMYLITRINEFILIANYPEHFINWVRRIVGIIAVFFIIISPSVIQINRVMILTIEFIIGGYIIVQIFKVIIGYKKESLGAWYVRIFKGITIRIFALITLLWCLLAMMSLWVDSIMKTFD